MAKIDFHDRRMRAQPVRQAHRLLHGSQKYAAAATEMNATPIVSSTC